jgi:anti-anti-sigma regulatory factor
VAQWGRMSLEIKVEAAARGSKVVMSGVVDETADFSALEKLGDRVELDLAGVRRINSFGARAWMDALRALTRRAQVVCRRLSPPVVDQLNMITGFLAGARVLSFHAQMTCEHCDHEGLHLFEAEEVRDRDGDLPPVTCPECGKAWELDDLEDQYTLFLREPTVVR